MKMFVVAIDEKKGLAATPINWMKKTATETGYYWPLYGLHFKLKNYVPLPIDSKELQKEWRWVPCTVLLNGEKFRTYADAEKAISNILKGENEVERAENEADEVESEEHETNELTETDEVESDDEKFDEDESVVVVSDEDESVVVVSDDEEVDKKPEYESQKEESEYELAEVEPVLDKSDEAQVVEPVSDKAESQVETEKEEDGNNSVEKFVFLKIDDVKMFSCNEEFIENKSGFDYLEKSYDNINENDERIFFNVCVDKTFTVRFFLDDVTFKKDAKRKDWIGVFDNTKLYNCLKNAVVKKLKLKDMTDTQVRNMFISNFERIKRAMRARL